MDAYVIYRKCLLLIAAYGGITATATIFPTPPVWTFSHVIGELLFSPHKLLLASLSFIIGFLAYSIFVQDACRYLWSIKREPLTLLFIVLASLSWVHLLLKGWVLAVFALSLALTYGIMDVNLEKRVK
ncbi:hypothetical protein [Halalkalibacter urbisdiaboli]|uniref:hypothetical protein n=1 Tax=Halalkalibacter urbisdiaboli TaxID=1960589 RepID=UPI000B439B33|nr:hypothetical protein [Halalkalibacter urbisdiaboli]